MDNKTNNDQEYIRLNFNHPNIKNLQLFAKESGYVKEGQKLGEFYIENVKQLITSPAYGKIVKLNLEDKYLIVEPCKHESRYKSLCTDCGYNT
jgi:hypothetical protein